MRFETNPNGEQVAVIFTPYITKKGNEFIILTAEYSALRSQRINIVPINKKGCLMTAFSLNPINTANSQYFLDFL